MVKLTLVNNKFVLSKLISIMRQIRCSKISHLNFEIVCLAALKRAMCVTALIDFHHFKAANDSCGNSSQTFVALIMCAHPMRTFFRLSIFVKTKSVVAKSSLRSVRFVFSNNGVTCLKKLDFFNNLSYKT